ncbi:MAG: XTP/dITP diphosphatase [Promethearchaeota archaeon]
MTFILYFITGNHHKFKEAKAYLESAINNLELRHCSLDIPEIQADDLETVAKFKIEQVCKKYRENMFIEDAGLFIPVLNGFPGVYSAYVKKMIDCSGILKLMDGLSGKARNAYFKACISLYLKDTGETKLFIGKINGKISTKERGDKGFGFDPIFVPLEPINNTRTFAEMSMNEKIKVSHRTKALEKLRDYLKQII